MLPPDTSTASPSPAPLLPNAEVVPAAAEVAPPTDEHAASSPDAGSAVVGVKVLEREIQDARGKHRVVLTREETRRGARLHAYDFCDRPAVAGAPCWTIHDGIDDCEFDLTVEFVGEHLYVRESARGAAVAVLYRTRCSGDLSAYDLKLVGYENGTKFAVRGTTGLASKVENWAPKRTVDVHDAALGKWAASVWDKHATERL